MLTVNVTDQGLFTCEVFGIPLPNVTWIKSNGDIVILDELFDNVSISQNDFDNVRVSILRFDKVSKFDESFYTCTAANGISNVLNTPVSGIVELIVQGMFVNLVCFIILLHICTIYS